MESNNPIYQWLSTVEYQGQTINQEQVKDTALATGIPWIRIPLEMSDDMRANGHSASRKRDSCHLNETNAPSTHETIPGSESHKRSRNCYELRPRYKTHENRYEYKGPSSAVETQSQSRKGRAKKPRGRRHTMNDDFRAINVTGNRLTLRSNTNLGIFNKGRSSSAANQHGNTPAGLAKSASVTRSQKYVAESNLAFSDMNFLSRSNLSPYPISTVRETLDGQHEREYHQQEVQFDDPAHGSKLDTSHSNKKLVDVKRKLDASVMPLLAFEEAPVSEISPVFSHSRSSSPMPHNKRRKISKQSSSIPYTWTETGVDDTEQSDALEQHLLNLLHVGVYPQALCSEITNTVLTGRYWSLAELWELLEERKASWSSEAGRQNRASPEANMGQLAAVKTSPQEVREVIALDHLDIPNAGSVQNEMSKQSADSNVACETACSVNNSPPKQPSVLHQQQDGPHEASDKPGCLSLPAARTSNSQDRFIDTLNEDQGEPFHQESAEDAVLFPASVPDVEQPHMSDIEFYELGRVDDDDVFYRTLDAAYRAIVRPEVAAEVASDLQQLLESPELNGNDLLNTPESTSIREPDILTRQAEGQEPEHLVTVSQDIVQDRYDGRPEPSWQQQLSTSHSNDPCVDQNNDLPWVATGYGQSQPRASTGIDAGQTKPPGLSGFWRQNRLY